MKALVILALLGVAAAHSDVPAESKQGVIPESKSYPKVIAYNYPFFGGSPFYHPAFPYSYPFTYPFMFPSPAVKKYEGEGKAETKSAGESYPREKRSAAAEADKSAYYTTYPFLIPTTYNFPTPTTYNFPTPTTYKFPTPTTYNFPAATFPAAYPYSKIVPFQYAPFPYTYVAKKEAEKAQNGVTITKSPEE